MTLPRPRARDLARVSGQPNDWDRYKTLRNEATRRQRKDKIEHQKRQFKRVEDEKDSAKLYSLTRDILGWKMSPPPQCFLVDGRMIRKQEELANIQAAYYKNKVKGIKTRLPRVRTDPLKYLKRAFDRWLPRQEIVTFKNEKVTENEVLDILKNFKNSHAFRIDNLDAATLKMGRNYITKPITYIVNLSLGN